MFPIISVGKTLIRQLLQIEEGGGTMGKRPGVRKYPFYYTILIYFENDGDSPKS